MSPARVAFDIVDPDSIVNVADLVLRDRPIRWADKWWSVKSVRMTDKLRVWAVETEGPACTKFKCGKPVTHLLTATSRAGDFVDRYYRCEKHGKSDVRVMPKLFPGMTCKLDAV